jgi:hypothetical protein
VRMLRKPLWPDNSPGGSEFLGAVGARTKPEHELAIAGNSLRNSEQLGCCGPAREKIRGRLQDHAARGEWGSLLGIRLMGIPNV